MFPRKNPLIRLGAFGATVFLSVWLYLVIPPAVTPRDIIPYGDITFEQSLPTRAHTILNASNVTQPKQTHHHSNDTLQKLASNMTLLKANQTVLQKIVKSVNQSIILDDDFSPNATVIVNPHPFKYIINQKNICKDKDIFLIAYIHTAPKHYKRRMVIRQTWGNHKNYDVIIRVVFVTGMSFDSPKVQSSLLFENEQYGDIVQEDFLDSYKNLTYKAVAGLKWISQNCRHARFVLKSDDDMFVNMFTLIRHLKSRTTTSTDRGLLMCLVWNRMKVMRAGKWKVSEKDYKDKYYPTYCSGSAFTMSTDVAVKLHKTSYYVPFFWVDDLYITGLVPMKSGIKHIQFMSTYVLDGKKLETRFTGPQWYAYIFSHVHNLDSIQSVWEKVKELNSGSVVPRYNYAIPKKENDKTSESKEKDHKKDTKEKTVEKAKVEKTKIIGSNKESIKGNKAKS